MFICTFLTILDPLYCVDNALLSLNSSIHKLICTYNIKSSNSTPATNPKEYINTMMLPAQNELLGIH